ncbi:hypothetical protein EUGRSUZ_J02412 [Eucalyptus grandis]|uniref:DUF4220 domain-containing protein n=2 Tax=Eucalyptus grandis TaxID=71139 RepID=A0A059AI94_EUCGR|nr:hypothetical protein EUGRSUZ_J02412 [Eucalyptus grandis]
MGFPLLPENTRELWKEWELRLLVLLSLFLQLTLVTRVSEEIHLQETKGTIDPKSQITAFWAPFLLLHLGGPDTITVYALTDNELWLRQMARLCVQIALAFYIYFMALSGSTLSILAVGMILLGFIKYVERTLCLYLGSKGQLRDSMLLYPDFGPIYPRILEQYTLRKEEGYQVGIDEVLEFSAPEDLSANSGQGIDQEKATTLAKAYEFPQLQRPGGQQAHVHEPSEHESRDGFSDRGSRARVHVRSSLHQGTVAEPAWGIIRWVINLSVLCAMLVFFSLQDRKDYPKVDVYITFLLISAAILLEIYSVLLAISSDWVDLWRLQRPGGSTISSAVAFLQICPNPRWSNSVAQFSLLKLSIKRRNRTFSKLYPRLAKLDEKLEKNYISYKGFKRNIKEWTFNHTRDAVDYLEQDRNLNSGLKSLKLVSEVLKRSNNGHLNWSVNDMEFDQSILIWQIATELFHYKDLEKSRGEISEHIKDFKMSKLDSRYMLYLLVLHPSMLPTGIDVLRYEDTSVDAQKFFEDKLEMLSKKETGINSSAVKTLAQNLFKKEKNDHTGVESCSEAHKSTESRDLCEVCHLLLHVGTQLPATKIRGGKSRSVLFDACHLASQLNKIESEDLGRKWKLIGKVWAKFLIYAACLSRGYQHSENLSRGGELITHVWLLMAHLGVVEPVQTSEKQCITKLVLD